MVFVSEAVVNFVFVVNFVVVENSVVVFENVEKHATATRKNNPFATKLPVSLMFAAGGKGEW